MHSPTPMDTVQLMPLTEEPAIDSGIMPYSLVNGDADCAVGNKVDFYPAVDEEYESRRAEQQAESLIPLKEDLADWLQRILDIEITTETFMDALDNGAALCRLAQMIQLKAELACKEGRYTQPIPKLKFKYRENAKSGTWFARDNCANFLQWCRDFGLNEGCMFESEDLVCHRQETPVVVCLLELARVGFRFGMESPSIIKIEKEIELEESELESQLNEDDPHHHYHHYHHTMDEAGRLVQMESVATQVSRTASLDVAPDTATSQNEAFDENEAGSSRKTTAGGDEDADDEGDGGGGGGDDGVDDGVDGGGGGDDGVDGVGDDDDGEADGDGDAEVDDEAAQEEEEEEEGGKSNEEEKKEEENDVGGGEEEEEVVVVEEEGDADDKGSMMMINGEDDFTQSNEGVISDKDVDGEQDTSQASGSTSAGDDGSHLQPSPGTLEDTEGLGKGDNTLMRNNDANQPPKKTPANAQSRLDTQRARHLDKKVKSVASKLNVSDKVCQISEGKYSIYGRVVFIRLLKEKHLMVRVGGGWDTLEHYLRHHNPTKIIEFKRTDLPAKSTPPPSTSGGSSCRLDPDTDQLGESVSLKN
ncbi:hypothetical protein Ahia01_000964200 [Argonauta hians]